MGISSLRKFPKTRYVETLTSGTSWTVPAGVFYVNATLFGGGGAGGGTIFSTYLNFGTPGCGGQVITSNVATTPGATITYAIGAGGTSGGSGGTTTFTGATSAVGGNGGSATGTAGASASNGGAGRTSDSATTGRDGGAGKIELEYWK